MLLLLCCIQNNKFTFYIDSTKKLRYEIASRNVALYGSEC